VSWPLRLVDPADLRARGEQPQPGDVWFAPWLLDVPGLLSVHYERDSRGKRPPIIVRCPDGADWCPDRPSTNGSGWTVTGDAPRFTASPSIASIGGYHGFLRDGVLTDDVEGKHWPASK
jgi:hypothetical protein